MPLVFFNHRRTLKSFPCEIENVRSANEKHESFGFRNQCREGVAEKGAHQHNERKANPDAKIERERLPETLPTGI